jgi:uncharacterized protein (DUF302 family)
MMNTQPCPYGEVRTTNLSFADAVAKLEEALKTEGFGVLCNIDIQAKLKEKLRVDYPRYAILGACNPPLAQQALERDVNLGLLLPCNAVVYEQGAQVMVGVVDPVAMLSIAKRPEMEGIARQVNEKLRRALDRVAPRASVQPVS